MALTIERSKDETQKQLTALTIENEQLNGLIRKYESERDSMANQLKAEVGNPLRLVVGSETLEFKSYPNLI